MTEDNAARLEKKLEDFFREARLQHTEHTAKLASLQTSLNHWAGRDTEIKRSIGDILDIDKKQQRDIDGLVLELRHLKASLRWALGIAGSAFALAMSSGAQILASMLGSG